MAIKRKELQMMQKLYLKCVVILAVISFIGLPTTNSIAQEVGGVVGNSYLTFLFIDDSFDLDVFSFEADGNFVMLRKDGVGTYQYNAPIFDVEWTSADETTTHNFTGLSLVGLIIVGWEDEMIPSWHHGNSGGSFFVGIKSNLIPD